MILSGRKSGLIWSALHLTAAAVDDAISKDAVDAMLRDALSPMLDPLITYLYRTPATASMLEPLIGKDSDLVRALCIGYRSRCLSEHGKLKNLRQAGEKPLVQENPGMHRKHAHSQHSHRNKQLLYMPCYTLS